MLAGYFFNDNRRESAEYNINYFNYYDRGYYPYQKPFAFDMYEDKLFTVFEDFGNIGNNIDIKGNVKTAELINFNKEAFYPKTNKDFIYNNFPNPFNSTTKIVYELIAYHKVKLTVYDILGREVKVLVDEAQEKGIHEVSLDANNLASGVYLLRLDAFDSTVKKIIVLK